MTDSARPAPVPAPAKRPVERRHHGDLVVDPYQWLRNPDDPSTIAHLAAEGAYADRVLAPLAPLRDRIVAEIKGRTRQTDVSLPVREGGYWYLSRTREGDDYPRYTRIPVALSPETPEAVGGQLLPGEEVYLDAQALAQGSEFFALGDIEVDRSGARLAYSLDTSGGEVFRLRVVELDSGEVVDEEVEGIGYGLVFTADGRHLYYTRNDESWRQCELWIHEIGTPAAQDRLVHREDDERFTVVLDESRDGTALLLHAYATDTSEAFLLPLDEPRAAPRSVAGRLEGLDYTVEHAGDHLLIVHNGRVRGFEIARAEFDDLGEGARERWRRILAAGPGERIQAVDAFASFAAVSMRAGGLPALRVLPRVRPGRSDGDGLGWDPDGAWSLGHGGELDAVHLAENREWETETLRYTLDSMRTPHTVAEADAAGGGEPRVLKTLEVPGFRAEDYRELRLWASAQDGVRVPISLMARADARPDGGHPGFLVGYGSYEHSFDPELNVPWLSLLDRGVVVAIAHVRGGGELGREWYEGGRLLDKPNTFGDFVAAARHLVSAGWFAPGRIAAEGGSAGGLLMGAVANLAPEAFRVVHARVPFVDALTTILDPSQPLTVGEWEEWGNPLEDPEVYRCMKGYSPYENVRAVEYPAILATTSFNDVRVSFGEAAKWVARLREVTRNYADPAQDGGAARPIVLRCEPQAGHGGRSGRSGRWRQRAEELAFVLDQLGAAER
ncbi:MAG: S9 family peptidase [Pseudoclavibacter sp.]|nr:S9 family peptidase [Pseudoclavibacter sp.]